MPDESTQTPLRVRAFRVARLGLAAVLAVAGLVATATGWLEVCDDQVVAGAVTEVCRAPKIDDGLALAYGLVLLLLVLPDLAEVGVPGLLRLRRRVGTTEARLDVESGRRSLLEDRLAHLSATVSQSSVVASRVSSTTTVGPSSLTINLPGLPAARLAAPGDDPAGVEAGPVTQARYAAAEYLLAHLLDEPPPSLGDVRLSLFLPVDDGSRLLPALAQDAEAAEAESWGYGQGVVGRAWQTGAPVSARGEDVLRGLESLPDDRRFRYERLTVVVAVPVLSAAGHPVGVLSAVSVDPSSPLDADHSLDELLTRADVLARVLVDLLGWASDDAPDTGPSDITLPSTPTTASEGAQWTP